MGFQLIPILETMRGLYNEPRSMERFNRYLRLLEGNTKGDLQLPITFYNPMAKAHVNEQLETLIKLNAEALATKALETVNQTLPSDFPEIAVVLNLADDAQGGWTNRYTTDYQSKFQQQALVKRNFCTPVFWSGETYDTTLIAQRVLESAYRTVHFATHSLPKTLEEHVAQEAFVAQSCGYSATGTPPLKAHYENIRTTEDYALLIAFLYGDTAATSLGFAPIGHTELPLDLSDFLSLD